MMFRKLYWVTETVDLKGISQVTGVYTSIPDLIRHGLRWSQSSETLRLTLTKLDSDQPPLGCWASPDFSGLVSGLDQFIVTDEFTSEQCGSLADALVPRTHAVA